MEEALSWFKLTGYTRFTISYADGDKPFAVSKDGATDAQAVEQLRNALDLFPARKTFKIDASAGADGANAKKHLYFVGSKEAGQNLGVNGPWGGWPQMPPQGFAPPAVQDKAEIAQMIKEAVAYARLEDEVGRLKEENARLKGESPQTATDAAFASFINTLAPYGPHILLGNNLPAAPVSGPRLSRTEEENGKIVGEALRQISARCDALNIDLPLLLQKLADIANREPAKLTMLNQMVG